MTITWATLSGSSPRRSFSRPRQLHRCASHACTRHLAFSIYYFDQESTQRPFFDRHLIFTVEESSEKMQAFQIVQQIRVLVCYELDNW
jgi:hypothetical protein